MSYAASNQVSDGRTGVLHSPMTSGMPFTSRTISIRLLTEPMEKEYSVVTVYELFSG